MSYTDPCGRCGNHRADCDCKEGYTPIAKKQTGIELIAKERQEQIDKHGRTVQSDVEQNSSNQLVEAIMMLVANIGFQRGGIETMPKECFEDMKPFGWGREMCWKMMSKPQEEQLQIIGAFAAAEIDRSHALKTDNQ